MTPKTRPLVALVSVLAGFAILVPLASKAGQASADANRAPIVSRTIEIPPIVIVGETPSGRRVAGEPAPVARKMPRADATRLARVVSLDQGGRPGARSVRAFGL